MGQKELIRMKNRREKISLIVILLVVIILKTDICLNRSLAESAKLAEVVADQIREEIQEREQPLLVQISEEDPSIGYVLVSEPDPIGLLPLPTEGEYLRTLRQIQPDGSEWVNVLHVTPDGFWMEDSNCNGHDCMDEGIVTLENREERILGNVVICLPHRLMLELLTREEAVRLFQ